MTKISLLLISVLTAATPSVAATIFTDGFETTTDLLPTTLAGNFTVTSGDIDVLQGSGPYGFLCAGASTCVDLDGDTQGTISSGNLTLGPGNYNLTFTLNNAQRGTLASTTVTLGSLFNHTYNDPISPNLVSFNFSVASTTTVALIFASNTPGAQGDILSGVTLSSVASASPVPEPSNLLLLSLGSVLTVFGSRVYRRRAIKN